MKTRRFNDFMALAVFVLSVVCLATARDIYTSMDILIAWMGVICFSCYFMREPLRRIGVKVFRIKEEVSSP